MDKADVTPAVAPILGPNGLPARRLASDECPRCGKDASGRVPSAGFGAPHDVCSKCGYEFEVLTCR